MFFEKDVTDIAAQAYRHSPELAAGLPRDSASKTVAA